MNRLNLEPIIQIENKIQLSAGNILKIITNKSSGYKKFGELYISFVNKNRIKAWKRHRKMTMNLVVPVGKVLFVIYKNNSNKFYKYILGQKQYYRLTVPPGFWIGFKGLDTKNMIINFSDIIHSDSEIDRKDKNQIKFNWKKIL